jgi:hypothetical protein
MSSEVTGSERVVARIFLARSVSAAAICDAKHSCTTRTCRATSARLSRRKVLSPLAPVEQAVQVQQRCGKDAFRAPVERARDAAGDAIPLIRFKHVRRLLCRYVRRVASDLSMDARNSRKTEVFDPGLGILGS